MPANSSNLVLLTGATGYVGGRLLPLLVAAGWRVRCLVRRPDHLLPRMKIRAFQSELWLPLTAEALFPFFANAANLDAITPPWLHFHIVTPPPIVMREGTLIDYRLRVRGVPLRWRTRIHAWQPPHRFVDEQLRGPYRLWIHEHTFEPRDGGTLARDHVRYAVPLDWLTHRWLVRPDIEKIFQFRAEVLRRRFASLQISRA